jgi:SAM-dependent methyltransferase
MNLRHLYDDSFYGAQEAESYRSAQVVFDVVWRFYRPASLVDVGCGVGPWLQAAREHGVEDFLGIDGEHVATDHLWIPTDHFVAHDLAAPLDVARRFDLAVSVEVAEHLPPTVAGRFVETLTGLAPVVLFSAAVPNQGGTGHLNEQWPEYWAGLFAEHGFLAYDCLRPRLWDDDRVAWWYRQNVMLFAADASLLDEPGPATEPLALVHPLQVDAILTRPNVLTLRELVRQLPPAVRRSIHRST